MDGIIKESTCDSKSEPSTQVNKSVKKPKTGFDRGLQPNKIIEASQVNRKLMFLVEWINGETDLLDSSLVYKKCPQMAVKFFMERLTSPENGINI
jgi:hypothetical protein